ncbi:hypothetical protein FRB94_002405 [Tulasnella sp. JGI-2019a]|nr:hypothetical protein FRB94_002405 [Tulasnella sp. JGI-2019a]KAG9006467.1 hypothetical protein FRB93_008595 [Tulasnella sp. JGI-2019a]KAG9036389.1 hypothetical protein FRB95_008930 [Tulasnella sp. JGI-2019a]
MSQKPSHHTPTGFRNPWHSALPPSWSEALSNPLPLEWAKAYLKIHPEIEDLKVMTPDWGVGKGGTDSLRATWFGHATVFVEMPSVPTGPSSDHTAKILFDPIFSSRAGPTQYTGPRRILPAPCQVKDLPGCDIVCISHNHYDHLDFSSILDIQKQFPAVQYFVPLGIRAWFTGAGIPGSQVTEMDWWDSTNHPQAESTAAEDPNSSLGSHLRITCVPAQHNTGRGAGDYGKTLWCGWIIEQKVGTPPTEGSSDGTRRGAVYFAGDTGYRRYSHSTEVCPIFKEIGEKFGPLDLSFIPIWRGGTLGFLSWAGLRLTHETVPSAFHASPSDAVSIHFDVRSNISLGIHFGTFVGATQETLEALVELKRACDDTGVPNLHYQDDGEEGEGESGETKDLTKGRMGTINLGETWVGPVIERSWTELV